MSQRIAQLHAAKPQKTPRTRAQLLALVPDKIYDDGRTKQCHADECNIEKIMARYNVTGTISHLAKYEGSYADFSDFDFHEQTTMLTRGREIFDALNAELRQEFGQSPAAFFAYVNDPANVNELRKKLPGLAQPGQQLPRTVLPDANLEAAEAAASELASATTTNPAEKAENPPKTPPASKEE